ASVGRALKDVGVQLKCFVISCDRLLKLLLGKICCPQVAVVRGCVLVQVYRPPVLFDRLPVFFLDVIDHAQIVVGVRILSVGLDGVLEIFLGLLVALDQQFGDSHLIENWGIIWLLGKSSTVVIQRIKVILLGPQCVASFLEVFGIGLLRRRLGPV